MFFELARPNVQIGIGGGGVPVSFKMFKNPIGFFNQDFIPALTTHKCLKNIKVASGQDRHLDSVLDHFGAVTVAIPEIFWFRSEIATCFSTEPVSEPVPMAVYGGVLLDLHVSKSSA